MAPWQWQQTMLRIKDPVASVDYYSKNFGMTLIAKLDFPQVSAACCPCLLACASRPSQAASVP